MINTDEHKKLLEQINEIEKNSINYFDVEKEFFLIDSDNLSQVHTKLYGYSIQQSGIYEEDNLTAEAIAGLDGRGCYVYVEVKDGKITIKQDLNGSWGIYLFHHGDYFALSNSFFHLLDHVKFKYLLTVNRDYCHHLMNISVCGRAYSKTAVNEIRLVERNAIINIDKKNKTLYFEFINCRERTVPLDSQEGIDILDRWIDFWGNLFRNIAQRTKFIRADLSGGFDSRMSFLVLLHSGVDLNKIVINSIKNDNHITYKQDYEIASQIAEHYGFKLNQPFPASDGLNYSLSDTWNKNFYFKQPFNVMSYLSVAKKTIDKSYTIKGQYGESVRDYSYGSPAESLANLIRAIGIRGYSSHLTEELSNSMKRVIQFGFDAICKKYGIKDPSSKHIPQYLYSEEKGRNFFGKDNAFSYLANTIKLLPIMDPELLTLRLDTDECPDQNLLMALLYVRYEPDLLTFPFQGGRSIAPETIEYAKKINERFPRRVTTDKVDEGVFYLQSRDLQTEKIIASGKNNSILPEKLPKNYMKAIFDSSRTYGLFTAYFDEELYQRAVFYYDTRTIYNEIMVYPIVGITKVLEDVEISQRNNPQYQDMKHFLEQDFATIHSNETPKTEIQIPDKFKRFLTARIDIQLKSKDGNFQILSTSDEKTEVTKPDWFQDDGIGYRIHSLSGNLTLVAKATVNGRIWLRLRSLEILDPKDKSKSIPYWIDYTKLTLNNKIIFDKLTPAWSRKPYDYTMNAKANEEIKIEIEWLPHRSDT